MVSQRQPRLLATAVFRAIGLAELPALRRVDPERSDALAVDLDHVTVDHGCAAGQVGGARGRRQLRHGDNKSPAGMASLCHEKIPPKRGQLQRLRPAAPPVPHGGRTPKADIRRVLSIPPPSVRLRSAGLVGTMVAITSAGCYRRRKSSSKAGASERLLEPRTNLRAARCFHRSLLRVDPLTVSATAGTTNGRSWCVLPDLTGSTHSALCSDDRVADPFRPGQCLPVIAWSRNDLQTERKTVGPATGRDCDAGAVESGPELVEGRVTGRL
jgi:hypothetical protein